MYIRHPNPLTKYVFKIVKSRDLPVCMHLAGDTKNVIIEGTKYKGLLKQIAIKYNEKQDNYIKR